MSIIDKWLNEHGDLKIEQKVIKQLENLSKMKLPYKRLTETAKIPVQGSEDAGAVDIYADKIEFKSYGRVWVKTNIAVAIPKGYRLMLHPRSSITKSTYQLQNSVGIIDADFRHGIQARFISQPVIQHIEAQDFDIFYPSFPHKKGDRIGQVYLEKIIPIEWDEVDDLDETDRKGGFGSTGNE